MPTKMKTLHLTSASWVWNRKIIYYYLLINDLVKEWGELVQVEPNERFMGMVAEHVKAYVEEGVQPPAAIAPSILNIADDVMAGREITMRTGDYIALQTHMRSMTAPKK